MVQIVVPVYNAEKYLKRCLDSLKNQTYSNWEAILIDDASSDNGADIIKEYQAQDERFKFIQLDKNSGVSNVRNLALSKLTGKYTAFLDSDDYWEPDMLEVMVSKAEEGNFEVVQCRFMYDYPGGRQVLPRGAFDADIELRQGDMKKVYFKMATGINMNHVCMKLIRTELIKWLRFDTSLKTAEDLQFCIRMFCKVENYCFVNRPMYHYCRNEESLTGKGLGSVAKFKANRRVSKDMKKVLAEWGVDSLYWRVLCDLRPYIIIISKIIRSIKEKIFSKSEDGRDL